MEPTAVKHKVAKPNAKETMEIQRVLSSPSENAPIIPEISAWDALTENPVTKRKAMRPFSGFCRCFGGRV